MKSNVDGFMKFFFSFLSVFLLFDFLLTKTVWGISYAVYAVLVFILVSMAYIVAKYGFRTIYLFTLWWIPFLIIVLYGSLSSQDYENVILYGLCLVLVLLSRKIIWNEIFPTKVFRISGIIMMIGIGVQILLPSLYDSYIAVNFETYRDIIYWANGYGFAGFTYQLGLTAIMLIYYESIILYGSQIKHRKIELFLCLICIFLTGKRALMLLSILLPLIIYYFAGRLSSRKARNIILSAIIGFFAIFVFMVNVDMFIDSPILGRLATTVIDIQSGSEITSGRNLIYEKAIDLFQDNKLLGIGFCQFKELSGFQTDVHNTYLQVLCECGIIGFLFFIVPLAVNLIYCIRLNKKSDDPILRISLFIQLLFIFYALTANVVVDKFCFVFYFMAVGVVIEGRNLERRKNE